MKIDTFLQFFVFLCAINHFTVCENSLYSVPDKICVGMDFTDITSGYNIPAFWLREVRETYTNCTHVVGNLQLVQTQNEIEFNKYLLHIREVSGYLVIHNVNTSQLSFPSLQIIRGQTLFRLNPVDPEYALVVSDTAAIKLRFNLTFPSLREISRGSVAVYSRAHPLCSFERINWKEIMSDDNAHYFYHGGGALSQCSSCDISCTDGYCWGVNPEDCQKFSRLYCHSRCEGRRCFGSGEAQCCHELCAGGCNGTTKNDCFLCKHVFSNGQCEEKCPSELYTLGSVCVDECPSEFVVDEESKMCLSKCQDSKHERNGRCVEVLPPEKKCRGPSDFWSHVHSGNIEDFRGCTIFDGSISIDDKIIEESLYWHNFTHLESHGPLDIQQLEIFSSLREITGSLSVFALEHEAFTNLSIFRNLEKVGDPTRYFQSPNHTFIFISYTSLKVVDFRSLKSIGSVVISANPDLCYLDSINWNGIAQYADTSNNKYDQLCKLDGHECSIECFQGQGCWGPQTWDCQKCPKYTYEKQCVDECPQGYGPDEKEGECIATPPPPTSSTARISTPGSGYNNGMGIGIILVIVGVSVLFLAGTLIAAVMWWKCKKKNLLRKYDKSHSTSENEPESRTETTGRPIMNRFRTLNKENLHRYEELGSGCFGTVYKGIWKPEENYSIPVAIKVLREITGALGSLELLNEAFVMASMSHPHLIILLGLCMSSDVMLVTELLPLGKLEEYLKVNKGHITPKIMLTWSTQIAQGMEYLESRRLVHRDLAARNVLLETPVHVKITDFGLSKLLFGNEEAYKSQMELMPVRWTAIESLQNGTFSHKSDVWAFGVTIWEILTYAELPYENVPVLKIKDFLEKGDRLQQPSTCSVNLHRVLLTTWLADPEARPTFKKLVEEFSVMLEDPGRYIVVPEDAMATSPEENQKNDRQLFRELASKMDIPMDEIVTSEEYFQLRGGYYVCPSETGYFKNDQQTGYYYLHSY